MNSDELNKRILKIIQLSIEPIVTEYLQQHPEYFVNCVTGSGMICQHETTLSYQPDKIKDVATVKPSIFIRLGGLERRHELTCYDFHPEGMYSKFTIDGSTVSDQELHNV